MMGVACTPRKSITTCAVCSIIAGNHSKILEKISETESRRKRRRREKQKRKEED